MDFLILVVDDDDDDFTLLTSHISQCQQDVRLVYAKNGVEAINVLEDGL